MALLYFSFWCFVVHYLEKSRNLIGIGASGQSASVDISVHVGSAVGQRRSAAIAVAEGDTQEARTAESAHAAATRGATCGATSDRSGTVDDCGGELSASLDVKRVD